MHPHVPGQGVAQRVQIGAAVMRDHALGVAGGSRGIGQRDGLPFVGREFPVEIGVAAGEEALVGGVRIGTLLVDEDHRRLGLRQAHRLLGQCLEVARDEQNGRFRMVEDEGDGRRVKTGVDGVQHGAGHGDAEMQLEHGRNIGGDHRHRLVEADAAAADGRGQAAATLIGLFPGEAQITMNNGKIIGINPGGSFQQTDGRQRNIIGVVTVQPQQIRIRATAAHRFPPRSLPSFLLQGLSSATVAQV